MALPLGSRRVIGQRFTPNSLKLPPKSEGRPIATATSWVRPENRSDFPLARLVWPAILAY
ncbi:hypothetical protein [Bradyrhizobium sp. LB13.1]